MSKNYYAILGVPQNATGRQVRQRFLTLARERHPDRFQGADKVEAELYFQQVTEAFNTLSDSERRRQHDLELAQMVVAPESDQTQVSKVYILRARQEAKQGNRQLAIEFLERATREDEGGHRAWYELAKLLEEDRRSLPRARHAIIQACDLQPMEPRYLELAGNLFAASGMPDKAEEFYQKALDWGGAEPKIEERLKSLRRGLRGGMFGKS
ncbi:MAG: DnaJ domain-containing protein [Acidobacteriota bacterium]|nr:DnaJ domain-containing protein [Acidobacteriota bacterium]MDH3522682.1 DnaJ domain-containing protein [Acidobacteriota bacterium]